MKMRISIGNSRLIVVSTCVLLLLLLRLVSRSGRTLAATTGSSSSTSPDMILVNCGDKGKSIDDEDRDWTGDDGSKFLPFSNNNTVATKANPRSQGSVPSVPFSTARIFTSAFTYSIPVQGDRYFLRLYFYRGDYGDLFKSDAVFDVFCGRYTLLKNFNTSHYAKALDQEYFVREYSINTSSSSTPRWINLTFTPSTNVSDSYAFVNGIELVPMPNIFTARKEPTLLETGRPYHINSSEALGTMYRLNVGGSTLRLSEDSGKLYRQWFDDSSFVADAALGEPLKKMDNVTIKYLETRFEYIAPRDVYGTARSTPPHDDSKLSWILAVDPGFFYLVRLHFCEIRYPFISKNQRVFSIYVNERAAASDFDVISRSGGIGIPTYYDSVTAFRDGDRQVDLRVSLRPDAQFKSHYMNVILNGLEVFKLGRFNGNLEDLMQTPPPRNQTKSEKEVGLVVGGIVGSVGALFLAGLIGYVIYRCWHRPSGGHVPVPPPHVPIAGSKISLWASPDVCRKFTLEQMKAATNDFSEALLLGVGGFGKVYRGCIDEERTKVAIKRANPMSEQGIREFRTEIELLPKLRHKHLVSLIGFCNENFEMILVYDYMAHGSFREHLYGTQKPPLTWKKRLEICIGAARGLHYLHTGSKHPIVHRDVKTTNILLDADWVAKLSDFGLSKTGPSLDKAHVSTVVKGSFGYLDPEYFECRQLTKKSDVYSFGVVLLEAMCARPAITQDLQMEPVSLARWATDCMKRGLLDEIIDPHIKGEISPQSLKTCVEAAEMCIAHSGRDRPTMADVLSNLELALQLQETRKATNNINGRREETCAPSPATRTPTVDGGTTIRTSLTNTAEDYSLSLSTTSDLLTPSAIFSDIVRKQSH